MSQNSDRSTRRTVLQRVGVGAISIGAIAGVSSANSEVDFSPSDHRDIEVEFLTADPSLLEAGEKTDLLMDASGDDWERSKLYVHHCGPSDWECEDTDWVNSWESSAVYDVSFEDPGFYELTGAALDENGSGHAAHRHFWVDDGTYGLLPEPSVTGPTEVEVGQTVTFDSTSSEMQYGDITHNRWLVDGDIQWGELDPVFETSFDEPGTYTVKAGVEGTSPSDWGHRDLHNDLVSDIHYATIEVTVTG